MRALPQTRTLDGWLVQWTFAGQQTALPVRRNFGDVPSDKNDQVLATINLDYDKLCTCRLFPKVAEPLETFAEGV